MQFGFPRFEQHVIEFSASGTVHLRAPSEKFGMKESKFDPFAIRCAMAVTSVASPQASSNAGASANLCHREY